MGNSRKNPSATKKNSGKGYSIPKLWGQDAYKNKKNSSKTAKGANLAAAVAGGAANGAGAILSAIRKSRTATIVSTVIAILLVLFLLDAVLNWGKVYAGVHIGEVDLGGKTKTEAIALVRETYEPRMDSTEITILANDEAQKAYAAGTLEEFDADDFYTVEEALKARTSWITDVEALSASLPAESLVESAMNVGREDGGILARLGAMIMGKTIEVKANYGAAELAQLVSSLDDTLSVRRVDSTVQIVDGVATAVAGSDGNQVDEEELKSQLDKAIFSADPAQRNFVAYARYAPQRITYENAQNAAATITAALADGAAYQCGDAKWVANATVLGTWTIVETKKVDGVWSIVPSISTAIARNELNEHLLSSDAQNNLQITFEVNGSDVKVHTNSQGQLPLSDEAAAKTNELLFGADGKGGDSAPADGKPIEVSVSTMSVPESLSLDDAKKYGVVTAFSEYTTDFSTGSSVEARNHNIRLASERLSYSVAKANGGIWSFNDTCGDSSSEATGFVAAGVILDNEVTQDYGGGICQVATTVFNAVYEAGLPVPERHNHSMYMASYPAGRDAAVSYPYLDLVWKNDQSSDVLLVMACGEDSVTCTLYGIDPQRRVETETGEWRDGEKYDTKYILDETLGENKTVVKTSGVDGSEIEVTRRVYSKSGELLETKLFASKYDPKTEIVRIGPGEKADAAKKEKKLYDENNKLIS